MNSKYNETGWAVGCVLVEQQAGKTKHIGVWYHDFQKEVGVGYLCHRPKRTNVWLKELRPPKFSPKQRRPSPQSQWCIPPLFQIPPISEYPMKNFPNDLFRYIFALFREKITPCFLHFPHFFNLRVFPTCTCFSLPPIFTIKIIYASRFTRSGCPCS